MKHCIGKESLSLNYSDIGGISVFKLGFFQVLGHAVDTVIYVEQRSENCLGQINYNYSRNQYWACPSIPKMGMTADTLKQK